MIALCPACGLLHEDTQEAAAANEPCPSCWRRGWRPDGLRSATFPTTDLARLEDFDQATRAIF